MTESNTESLGSRMKTYEAALLLHKDGDYVLPCDGRPLIARIDGHNFSTFTRGFEKPFDVRLSNAMVETAKDLMIKFQAVTAYTQSDEITIVFMPKQDEKNGEWQEWPHRGRLLKLCTLLSSYAAARFNAHLCLALEQIGRRELSDDTVAKIKRNEAHFDARLFAVPNASEAYNNVYWRATYDCVRNAIHGLARVYFSDKQLHAKNRNEMKAMLFEQKSVDFETMPDAFKYGTFVKKRLEKVTATDQKSGNEVQVTRTGIASFSTDKFTTETICSKYDKAAANTDSNSNEIKIADN